MWSQLVIPSGLVSTKFGGGGGLGGVGVNHALIAGFIFYMVSEYFSQIITTIILGIE